MKIIVALDTPDSFHIADQIKSYVDGFKINHLLWEQSDKIKALDAPEHFIDCKIWDTPNTVLSVTKRIIDMGATMTTLSTFNNPAVYENLAGLKDQIKLLGVTYLTSWSAPDQSILYRNTIQDMWKDSIARTQGVLSGLICSPLDISSIRDNNKYLKVCPGIGHNNSGQSRMVSPKRAINLGADYLVIGRTITESNYPVKTIKEIRREMRSLL